MFVINQKPFPLGKIKDSFKNTISVDQKTKIRFNRNN